MICLLRCRIWGELEHASFVPKLVENIGDIDLDHACFSVVNGIGCSDLLDEGQ